MRLVTWSLRDDLLEIVTPSIFMVDAQRGWWGLPPGKYWNFVPGNAIYIVVHVYALLNKI